MSSFSNESAKQLHVDAERAWRQSPNETTRCSQIRASVLPLLKAVAALAAADGPASEVARVALYWLLRAETGCRRAYADGSVPTVDQILDAETIRLLVERFRPRGLLGGDSEAVGVSQFNRCFVKFARLPHAAGILKSDVVEILSDLARESLTVDDAAAVKALYNLARALQKASVLPPRTMAPSDIVAHLLLVTRRLCAACDNIDASTSAGRLQALSSLRSVLLCARAARMLRQAWRDDWSLLVEPSALEHIYRSAIETVQTSLLASFRHIKLAEVTEQDSKLIQLLGKYHRNLIDDPKAPLYVSREHAILRLGWGVDDASHTELCRALVGCLERKDMPAHPKLVARLRSRMM
jgi:hypothetical protein